MQHFYPVRGTQPQASQPFQKLKIGAGGLTTGLDINADGTLLLRTDVGGAYIYNRSVPNPGNAGGLGMWVQLVTSSSMPAAVLSLNWDGNQLGSAGCFEVVGAPSDSSVIYMVWNGYIRVSTSRGGKFVNCNLAQKTSCDPQATARYVAKYVAVDPVNPDGVIFSTMSNGIFESTNGRSGASASWSALTGIATPTASGNWPSSSSVVFDPTSGTTNGRTNICYIAIFGTGVYQRTTPTGSFSLLAGTPTHPTAVRIAADGHLYVSDDTAGKLWQFINGSGWTDKTPPSPMTTVQFLACDPASAGHVIALQGNIASETTNINAGSPTWTNTSIFGASKVATDIPYLASLSSGYALGGSTVFDTVVSGQVWTCGAQGLWTTSSPLGSLPVWTSVDSGIEELVGQRIIVPPGYLPVVVCQDIGILQQPTANKYVTVPPFPSLVEGDSADYATNNFAVVSAYTSNGGFVSNGSGGLGSSWVAWGNQLDVGTGGDIACSTALNWMACSRGDVKPKFTTDGGNNWADTTTTATNGWNLDAPQPRPSWNLLCADRVTTGTFWVYNQGSGTVGLYVSTNSGANIALLTANLNPIGVGAVFGGKMMQVPGNPGHLFICNGYFNNQSQTAVFYRTTNANAGGSGTVTWSDVSNGTYTVRDVWSFGLGAAKSGQSYPVIYIYGAVSINGGAYNYGIWRSVDNCASWQQLSGMFPCDWIDQITDVSGDMANYGYCYLAFVGTGYGVGVYP